MLSQRHISVLLQKLIGVLWQATLGCCYKEISRWCHKSTLWCCDKTHLGCCGKDISECCHKDLLRCCYKDTVGCCHIEHWAAVIKQIPSILAFKLNLLYIQIYRATFVTKKVNISWWSMVNSDKWSLQESELFHEDFPTGSTDWSDPLIEDKSSWNSL